MGPSRVRLRDLASTVVLVSAVWGCNLITGVGDYEKTNGAPGGGGAATGAGGAGGGAGVAIGPIKALGTGRFGSCAITEDGKLWCWGLYPGRPDLSVSTTPVQVAIEGTVITVAMGYYHRCAVVEATAGPETFCWGDNSRGQIGRADVGFSLSPVVVDQLGGVALTTISAGHSHTCAIGDETPLFCWGDNGYGQLAIDGAGFSDQPLAVPVPVAGGGGGGDGGAGGSGTSTNDVWERGSAGMFFTCGIARRESGGTTTYCWGANDSGQLGQDPTTLGMTSEPRELVLAQASPIERVYPGGSHLCVRDTDKNLFCLGANDFGQIGNGTVTAFEAVLAPVSLPENLDTLAAGARHTCARYAMGTGYTTACWGANDLGQLNVAGGMIEPAPREIAFEPTALFSFGRSEHVCVVKEADGSVWCWGANDAGQLGVGTISPFEAPQLVSPR